MKKEYQVLFQRGCEEKRGRWLNGGMMYCKEGKRVFDTLEEAEQCRDTILKEENKSGNPTYSMNGIGIEVMLSDEDKEDLKLKRIKIRCREVTEWEDL